MHAISAICIGCVLYIRVPFTVNIEVISHNVVSFIENNFVIKTA